MPARATHNAALCSPVGVMVPSAVRRGRLLALVVRGCLAAARRDGQHGDDD